MPQFPPSDILQIIIFLFVTIILVKPFGWYMARVYTGKPCLINQIFAPVEHALYKLCGCNPGSEMNWRQYLSCMLCLNLLGVLLVYVFARTQFYLPFNPQKFSGLPADLAFNTAISYVTNTNWQAYVGENTMSYFTQMSAMTVQNFLSAATGMSILVALIRGVSRRETSDLGNYWVDMVRSVLYILLPLAIILSLALVSQGVIQNLNSYQSIKILQPFSGDKNTTISEQTIPMGPAASQIAIKQLGTNGGGFFNANSAHPFENPTPVSNFLELLAIVLIPAAFCYTYGVMINDRRQGWAILIAMYLIFIPVTAVTYYHEQLGNPALTELQISGGNMEGKEIRFGVVNSALWALATTGTANGSTNAMLDSFTPIGGMMPLWMLHLGEVIFGGVGTGLYGMLMFVIMTVFIAGLMVGRTPEYLGNKIQPFEMKMASIAILIMSILVLIATAVAAVTKVGISSLGNPGAHGFSEILYAFSSLGNNNGSAFAGLNANTKFYNILGAFLMLVTRYWVAIPVLSLAGSLAKKRSVPTSAGTLATHTPLFIVLLISVIIIIAALSFLPALALGPIIEHLMLWEHYGH